MIEVRQIEEETAKSYLKTERGFDEIKIQKVLDKLRIELYGSVLLKDEKTIVKGPIFEKFTKGVHKWLGAFDGNQFVGIHWHSISWHGNNDQNTFEQDIFDGLMFSESEEITIALDKKFREMIKDNFVVNYSFCFPDDEFSLDLRKTLGYTVWAAAKYPKPNSNSAIYYLKRLSGSETMSVEEIKKRQIEKLKKELEALGG